MCQTKTLLVLLPLYLLIAASFCIDRGRIENKLGNQSEIESQGPCKNEYKKYCLNGGECFYLDDKKFVGSNCSLLYREELRENYMWWDYVKI